MYEAGRGVAHSDKQALHWYGLAATAANPSAQYRLAMMNLNGFGMKPNPVEARKWFARAAAQGDPHAQRQLGTLYAKGLGVAQNKMLAYMWLDIARGLGEQSAVRTLAELSETMSKEAVTRARELATRCIAKSYQDCDAAT
jgi:TPR repeat protein